MYAPLIAFLVTLILLVIFLKSPLSSLVLDKPNARSLHAHQIPRLGGVAVVIGVAAAWLTIQVDSYWLILLFALAGMSLIDDARGLSVRWRLLAQFVAAAYFVWIFMPNMAWWLAGVVLLALVWLTNLYNFMDGSDGMAGGMGLFGFAAYALASYLANDMQLALISVCISASCIAFLIFNFHPAKIFMGDAGSIPLGFLAGAIGLYGWQHALWVLWFPILVFSPFMVDATATLAKRALRGEKVWQAHREHYYQRLVQMGWGHRKTAIAAYVLMCAVVACALLMRNMSNELIIVILVAWLLAYALMLRAIDKKWYQFQISSQI